MENNTTPDLSQDWLISAGSNMSLRDIYDEQLKLPIHRNKYYKTEQVDALFVTINGILSDISKQACISTKALSSAREESSFYQKQAQDAMQLAEEQERTISALQSNIDKLLVKMANTDQTEKLERALEEKEQALNEKSEDYRRLLETSADKVVDLQKQNEAKDKTIQTLSDDNKQLTEKAQELETKVEELRGDTATLQTKFNMIKYKYQNAKDLSGKRIAQLCSNSSGK